MSAEAPDKMRLVHQALDMMDAGLNASAARALSEAMARYPGHPEPQYAFGQLLLATGRLKEGWPLLAHRTALSPRLVPPVTESYPEWRGEPLAGRSLLVWVEQGLGDQIMMARFIAPLRAAGARVTLACNPALARLFAPLADEIIAIGPGERLDVARHDYWSRYFSLPEHLGVTLETLSDAPYLPADPGPNTGRIGLMWSSSATGPLAQMKNLPAELAQIWLDRGFVSLRPEDSGAGDFADTAAIMAGLDLVITVDTAVAHLAGALGRPVWILLPYRRLDWRWMGGRTPSPWYRTARLFRQPGLGDWESVTRQVDESLAQMQP